MVQGRHSEDATAGGLKRYDLDDHRKRLGNKDASDDNKQQFLLDDHGDGAQGAAESQRTGISHEDLGRIRVEPEKPEERADQGADEHGHLADVANIDDVQIGRKSGMPDDVGQAAQRHRTGDGGAGRETVEAVREVDGVRGAGDHQHHEGDVEPAKLNQRIFEKWNGEHRAVIHADGFSKPQSRRFDGKNKERDTENQRKKSLPQKLVTTGKSLGIFLGHLEIVVDETDGAETDGDQDQERDVAIGEIAEEQHGGADSADHQEPAHRGRAQLVGVKIQFLAILQVGHAEGLQSLDKAWTEKNGKREREGGRERRAERDVLKETQGAESGV